MFNQRLAFSFIIAIFITLSIASSAQAKGPNVFSKVVSKFAHSPRGMALIRPAAIASFYKFCLKNPRAMRIYKNELSKDNKNKAAVWGNRLMNLTSFSGLMAAGNIVMQQGPTAALASAQNFIATTLPNMTLNKGGLTALATVTGAGVASKIYKRFRRAREVTLHTIIEKQYVQKGIVKEIPALAFASVSQEGRNLMVERLVKYFDPGKAKANIPQALVTRVNFKALDEAVLDAFNER